MWEYLKSANFIIVPLKRQYSKSQKKKFTLHSSVSLSSMPAMSVVGHPVSSCCALIEFLLNLSKLHCTNRACGNPTFF